MADDDDQPPQRVADYADEQRLFLVEVRDPDNAERVIGYALAERTAWLPLEVGKATPTTRMLSEALARLFEQALADRATSQALPFAMNKDPNGSGQILGRMVGDDDLIRWVLSRMVGNQGGG